MRSVPCRCSNGSLKLVAVVPMEQPCNSNLSRGPAMRKGWVISLLMTRYTPLPMNWWRFLDDLKTWVALYRVPLVSVVDIWWCITGSLNKAAELYRILKWRWLPSCCVKFLPLSVQYWWPFLPQQLLETRVRQNEGGGYKLVPLNCHRSCKHNMGQSACHSPYYWSNNAQ